MIFRKIRHVLLGGILFAGFFPESGLLAQIVVRNADRITFGDGLSLTLPAGWKPTTLQTGTSAQSAGRSRMEPEAATLLLFARPGDPSRDGSLAIIRDTSFGSGAGPRALQDIVVRLTETAAEDGYLTESFETKGDPNQADNVLYCAVKAIASDGGRRSYGCVAFNRFPEPSLRCLWQWREPDPSAAAEFEEFLSSLMLEGVSVASALSAEPARMVTLPRQTQAAPEASDPASPSSPADGGIASAAPNTAAVPTGPTPSPTPAGVLTPEVSDIITKSREGLVVIEGDEGTGSGFVCNLGGQPWLLTNTHVLAGNPRPRFTKLNGSALAMGPAALGVGHDICRISVPEGTMMLEAMTDTDSVARIGDPVAVLGNAEGAGVIKPFEGRIVGLGPNLVEVDAPFVPGNSGSPIIHVPTGKVIGIATYLVTRKVDPEGEGTVKTSVRRFGYRLDSVKTWEPVDWVRFYAQAAQVAKIQETGEDFVRLFSDAQKRAISPSNYGNSGIKRALETFERVAGSGRRISAADMANARRDLFANLRIASMTDLNAFDVRTAYDYFRREVAEEKTFREDVSSGFTKALESVRR